LNKVRRETEREPAPWQERNHRHPVRFGINTMGKLPYGVSPAA
jgi:hypothetical protein